MSEESAKTKVILFRSRQTREWERLLGEFHPGDAEYQCAKLRRPEGPASESFVVELFEWREHGLKIEDYYFKQRF